MITYDTDYITYIHTAPAKKMEMAWMHTDGSDDSIHCQAGTTVDITGLQRNRGDPGTLGKGVSE